MKKIRLLYFLAIILTGNLALPRHPEQLKLRYRTWKLSKTAFVQGKQRLKHLYLQKYKKQVKNTSGS